MLAKIIAWLRQPTTIGGFSVLFATIGGLLQHLANPAQGLTGSQAIIPLIGAVAAIAMPDNTHGQAQAVQMATEAIGAASNTLLNTAATVAKRTTPLLLVVGVGMLVSGCANQGNDNVMVSGTNYVVTTVTGAEVALTAAEQVATAYVTLPLCPQPAPTLCSVKATSDQIKALAAKADADLVLAKAGSVTVPVLVADISALTAAVPAVQTKTQT